MEQSIGKYNITIIIFLISLLAIGLIFGLVRFNYYENKIVETSDQLKNVENTVINLNTKLLDSEKKIIELTTPGDVAANVIAQEIQNIPLNQKVVLESGVEIQALNIIQARGGKSTIQQNDCTNGITNGRPVILMKFFNTDERGWCMDGNHFEGLMGIQNPTGIGVEINVTNNGVTAIDNSSDRFVKVLYSELAEDVIRWKLSPVFISVRTSIPPSTSQRFRAGFIVPGSTQQIVVLHGDWISNSAIELSSVERAYKVNFTDKVIVVLSPEDIQQITL